MTVQYLFADWQLLPASRELRHQGVAVPLGGRAFDLLLALLEAGDQLATKDVLYERVWPGLAVEPNNLQVQVWTLRKLLGAQAIVTVARRGYRLTLPVQVLPISGPAIEVPAPSAPAALDALATQLLHHRFVNLIVGDDNAVQTWLRQMRPALLGRLDGGIWLLDASDLQRGDAPLDQLLHRLLGKRALVVLMGGHLAMNTLRLQALPALARWDGLHLLVTSPHGLGLAPAVELSLPLQDSTAAQAAPSASSLRWHPRPTAS